MNWNEKIKSKHGNDHPFSCSSSRPTFHVVSTIHKNFNKTLELLKVALVDETEVQNNSLFILQKKKKS